jgi:hypothetical protein
MRKRHVILLALVFLVAGLLIAARTALNNAILTSDLDAAGHKIVNLPNDQPMPPPVLGASIPPTWLGTTATTAAQGNLAEFLSHKGVADGYASLDSSGKLLSSQLPALAGTGTVTSVSVATANGVSGTVTAPTITPAITIILGNIVPKSVEITETNGNGSIRLFKQGAGSDPTLLGQPMLWADSIGRLNYRNVGGLQIRLGAGLFSGPHTADFPDKDGVFAYTDDLATTIVGVGGSHKGGLVPDTGASGTASDYLARDATWKAIPTAAGPTYQPQVPVATISPSTNTTGARNITISDSLSGTAIFYEIGASAGPFLPYTGTVSLPAGSIIYTYAAKAGYTNSPMANYTNPNP